MMRSGGDVMSVFLFFLCGTRYTVEFKGFLVAGVVLRAVWIRAILVTRAVTDV